MPLASFANQLAVVRENVPVGAASAMSSSIGSAVCCTRRCSIARGTIAFGSRRSESGLSCGRLICHSGSLVEDAATG